MLPNTSCPDVFSNSGPDVLSQVKVLHAPRLNHLKQMHHEICVSKPFHACELHAERMYACAVDGRLHHSSPEGRNILLCMPGSRTLVRTPVNSWALQLQQSCRQEDLQRVREVCSDRSYHEHTLDTEVHVIIILSVCRDSAPMLRPLLTHLHVSINVQTCPYLSRRPILHCPVLPAVKVVRWCKSQHHEAGQA